MGKYVALYCRTSTNLQEKGLESQIHALNNYCQLNHIEEFRLFSDEGVSGTKESRPALDELMRAVHRGEVTSVIVFSFSRFARSTKQLLLALEMFDRHEVSFISLSEQLDTRTSVGKFVYTIFGALAALERDTIVTRVKSGLANAKAKGRILGRPQVHKDKVAVIRHLACQKLSQREIARLTGVSQRTVCRILKRESKVAG